MPRSQNQGEILNTHRKIWISLFILLYFVCLIFYKVSFCFKGKIDTEMHLRGNFEAHSKCELNKHVIFLYENILFFCMILLKYSFFSISQSSFGSKRTAVAVLHS